MEINEEPKSNTVQLNGYIGKKPVIKTLANGSKMARTTVATNDYYYTVSGKLKKETQWHNVVAWGKNASQMEHNLDKGSPVSIQGKLKVKTFTDSDGEKYSVTEVEILHYCFTKNKISA